MQSWLELARGPMFAACFLCMVLGLARLVLLRLWEISTLWKRASHDPFPVGQAFRDVASWLVPVTRLHRVRQPAALASFLFHVGAILVALFLADHVWLWRRSLGISWYTLPVILADTLTVAVLLGALALLAIRIFDPPTRFMSGGGDYFLLLLMLVLFGSGLLASHPAWNLFSYQATMLVHTLSGNLLFVLMPFTKLAHAVLFPFERVSSEVFWRFPAGAGDRVADALHGKEPATL